MHEFFDDHDPRKTFRRKLMYPLCYEVRRDLKHVYDILHERLSNIRNCYVKVKGKGKVIPLQARCGPEGG